MEINTTALNPTNYIPYGNYDEYVKIDVCKDYIQNTALWNKIYLLMLFVTVVLFVWYVWKTDGFKKEKRIIKKVMGE